MMDTQEAARLEVAAALPEAIARALDSYLTFSRAEPPEEPREYAQFQTACKNALAHLDALLRLAQALQPSAAAGRPSGAPADGSAELKALLRQARAAVSGLASPASASPPSASPDSRSSSGSGPTPRA